MTDKEKNIEEMKYEGIGVIEVGEDERDFIAGEDVDLRKLKFLKKQDRVWKATDQSYGKFKTACTMMSTYGGILSIFNMDTQEDEKEAIIQEALYNGYKVGEGWWTRLGVKTACKVWNKKHLDKRVIYLKSVIGSEQWKIAIEKGFPIITSYRTSPEYYWDRQKDGVVDGKDFDNFTGGHAIAAYGSEDENIAWEHVNTYPKRKYNTYKVKYGYDLVKNGVYYPGCYILIPEGEYNLEELKQKKKEKIQINAFCCQGSLIWKYTENNPTLRKELEDVVDHFRKAYGIERETTIDEKENKVLLAILQKMKDKEITNQQVLDAMKKLVK